ncbi:MAG TPA: hypothetical protein VF799_09330 [Geobacteraceae bacterium]
MDRRKLALVILLSIFAGAVTYAFLHQPPRNTVAKLKYTPGMRAEVSRTAKAARSDLKLRLDLLDRDTPRFSGFRRNIFRPIFAGEIKQPLLPLKPVKVVLPVPPPLPPPPPPVPPTPAQIAAEEMAGFKFVGFLKKENRKTVFLARGNELFLVKKGDRIAGKYEVAGITDGSMAIRLAETGEQIVIPLEENRALMRR